MGHPSSPLWTDAEDVVPAQSCEGIHDADSESGRQGWRHRDGYHIKGSHNCVLHLMKGRGEGNMYRETWERENLVNLKLEIKVDDQSVDESTASCIQRHRFKLGRERERER